LFKTRLHRSGASRNKIAYETSGMPERKQRQFVGRDGQTDRSKSAANAERSKSMTIHKKILEWQAAHPNITWIGWGVVWAIVFVILFWPRKSG
jgi:hypothetical protein